MKIVNNTAMTSLDKIVLFPFDDYAIPFQRGVQLNLRGYQGGTGRTRIVLEPGASGSHDSEHVTYYGTVKRVGDELWMWYLGQGPVESGGPEDPWFQRVCLARSKDGYNWERPNLALVEYHGGYTGRLDRSFWKQ